MTPLSLSQPGDPSPEPLLGWHWSRGLIGAVAALICAATLALHAGPLAAPVLLGDDFQILAESWNLDSAVGHLLAPHNEHIFPPGRISAWLLVQAAGSAPRVPLVAAFQGPLALLLGLWLVYACVRRETGHPFYGLASMAIFGVTTQYVEAVSWFSASFGILALDTFLLGLLAAQAWSRTHRWPYLAGCFLAGAASPGWFGTGVLAGPLCSLYLACPKRTPPGSVRPNSWVTRLAPLTPVLGTLLYLGATLPENFHTLVHLEHYGEGTARKAIKPVVGLEYTARSLVDNLLLNILGISGVHCDPWQVARPLALLVLAAVFWARGAPHPRLIVVGIGLVLLSYFLIYSGRARWDYEQVSSWSRYQLWSHLGLTLFIAGGLPRWHRWLLTRPPLGSAICLTALLAGLLATEFPRSQRPLLPNYAAQQEVLRRVKHIDDRCRRRHISAARAREVLPPEWFYYHSSLSHVSVWEFLHGSDDPRPADDEEVRQFLFGPESPQP